MHPVLDVLVASMMYIAGFALTSVYTNKQQMASRRSIVFWTILWPLYWPVFGIVYFVLYLIFKPRKY